VNVHTSVMTNLASLTAGRTGSVRLPPGAPHPRPAHSHGLQHTVLEPGHEPNKVKL
jgi:hypothetical protein